MDFTLTDEQQRLRDEVRSFLEQEKARGYFRFSEEGCREGFSQEFSRKVAERGWIGLTWPKEYGGRGLGHVTRLVYAEEMLRYGAPIAFHALADRQIGDAIINFGTEEQKKEFLPRILNTDISFCLGLSEPSAGSDLASIQTYAREEEDDYVIDGQKVWTTHGHLADYCWLLARTDRDAPKHRGISQFIVAMKSPGITIRPLTCVHGEHYLNEVFFDGVHVSKKYLVGEKNKGFYQIGAQLAPERGDLDRLLSNYPLFADVVEDFKSAPRKGKLVSAYELARQKLAELRIELEIGRLLVYRVACLRDAGLTPNYETAVSRTYCAEFEQRLARTIMEILGLYGQLMPGNTNARLMGRAARNYLFSFSYTIAGGTTETMRNIIALRGLGIPVD